MAEMTVGPRASRVLCVAACVFCVLTVAVEAHEGSAPPQSDQAVLTLAEAAELLRVDAVELERLAEQHEIPSRRIGASWRFSRAALMAWLRGDWAPTVTAAGRTADRTSSAVPGAKPSEVRTALTDAGMAAVTGRSTAGHTTTQQTTTQQTDPAPPADAQGKPIGEAPEERNAEDIFLRGQRVLLGRGEVVVDLGQFYSRSDDLALAAVEDRVGLATLQQSTLSTLLVGRVGIFRETELFASTSFHHQNSRAFFGSASLSDSQRSVVPGVGVGIRHTFLRESARRPDIIASFAAQLPGDNYPYGIGGGVVLVKSFDPVVVFANVNYNHSFKRVVDGVSLGREDRVDVSLGYSL